jgi:hypothetical protein
MVTTLREIEQRQLQTQTWEQIVNASTGMYRLKYGE